MRDLINVTDLTEQEIEELIDIAAEMMEAPEDYLDLAKGKILGTLFFEPSTRTRLSFTSAMMSMGGNVLGFSEAASSSSAKGESVADTVRTVSYYCDIIAMRHHKEGAPRVAAGSSTVPVINAGDGGHFHPTQTLTDLTTIRMTKGRFTDMTIGLCGDLCFGRTVHSLIEAMKRYEGIKFILISPPELRLPKYMRDDLDRDGIPWREVTDMEEVMPELDILYMTRVQRERFFNEEEYLRLKDTYILDMEKLENAKEDLSILHPLPRVNEIAIEVDDDPRAKYFEQVRCGRFIRMALIAKMLGLK